MLIEEREDRGRRGFDQSLIFEMKNKLRYFGRRHIIILKGAIQSQRPPRRIMRLLYLQHEDSTLC